MKMQRRVEEKRTQLIDLYKNQGYSIKKLESILGMSKITIRKVIKDEGLEIRNQSSQQLLNNGSGSLKHDAFDILTPEALYWIGFIYADGYVYNKGNRYLLSIDLSTRDKAHLEKFKSFLSAGVSIRDNIRKQNINGTGTKEYFTSIITISSKQIFNRLTALDFTNNKTYDATVHFDLVSSRDFWRGLFDGDGWISKTHTRQYQYAWVGLCGTKDTIQCFIDFVKSNNILTEVIEPRFKKGTKNNYETAFVNKVGKQVLDLLYKDSSLYLDRKYQKYLELCNEEIIA